MPSTTYHDEGLPEGFHFSELVASGTFTSAANGHAIDWSTDQGAEVPWESDADTRSIKMTFQVSEVIDHSDDVPAPNTGDELTVWVVVDGADDPAVVSDGLLGLSQSVVFLADPPNYDDGWALGLDGALIAPIDESDGTLTVPVLEKASSLASSELTRFAAEGTTVDDLVEAAQNPTDISVEIPATG